ncbi:hypothetical protein BC834DRAFT_610987 [Gloeopeniophorella convolvens]|nr:hypothetical protein BC834DRAFT_610987 [Gloeopeniophorella convolvens]
MPALIPVDNSLGALLLGMLFSAIIYGVTWLQVYAYFAKHGRRDSLGLRTFVATLMVLDSLNMAFIIHSTYVYCITNFGDYRAATQILWSLPATALSAMMIKIAKDQIYKLSNGVLWIPVIMMLMSYASFSVALVFSIKIIQMVMSSREISLQSYVIGILALHSAIDIVITVSMVYYLLLHRGITRKTDSVLNLLALYVVSSGLLTLLLAVAGLIVACRLRGVESWIYVPFLDTEVRMYPCAFMSILNSRDRLRQKLEDRDAVVLSLTEMTATVPHQLVVDQGRLQDGEAQGQKVPGVLPELQGEDPESTGTDSITYDERKGSVLYDDNDQALV